MPATSSRVRKGSALIMANTLGRFWSGRGRLRPEARPGTMAGNRGAGSAAPDGSGDGRRRPPCSWLHGNRAGNGSCDAEPGEEACDRTGKGIVVVAGHEMAGIGDQVVF